MNMNEIYGIVKIDKRGLCKRYFEFKNASKKIDPQLIAGFFYAMKNFTSNFFGEELEQFETDNYKIIFKPDKNNFTVYIVDKKFNDEILNSEIPCNYDYCINDLPKIN
ncbi:MAG: hypothetical protein GF329_08920 [Candidatus Lokiarchaeota archaeon]|nr:hypothetical protein [Candidatus Lokiarchaeota archaeon]